MVANSQRKLAHGDARIIGLYVVARVVPCLIVNCSGSSFEQKRLITDCIVGSELAEVLALRLEEVAAEVRFTMLHSSISIFAKS